MFSSAMAENKSDCPVYYFINVEDTSHFFFFQTTLVCYEMFEKRTTTFAFGNFYVAGKESVKIPCENDHLVEAFHRPQFPTNKLPVGSLT